MWTVLAMAMGGAVSLVLPAQAPGVWTVLAMGVGRRRVPGMNSAGQGVVLLVLAMGGAGSQGCGQCWLWLWDGAGSL